jgi:hypothetical protein
MFVILVSVIIDLVDMVPFPTAAGAMLFNPFRTAKEKPIR